MKIQQTNQSCRERRGTTILEVIIAIGVLLFGLVGLAAVIPAASQLARNSIDFSRGSSIAVAAASNFEAAGLNVRGNWVGVSDAAGAPTFSAITAGQSVCIDPLFVSRPENFIASSAGLTNPAALPGRYEPWVGPGTNNGFRRNRFPYYPAQYNPLVDPSGANGDPLTWAATPTPRLIRASLSGGSPTGIMSAGAASRIFDDANQLVFEQPDDDTLPATQIFRDAASGAGSFFPATRSASPKYSWFSTILPTGSNTATASVVVIKERDRLFETPATGNPLPSELSERLTLVHPPGAPGVAGPIGFSNGAGGTLNLIGSVAINSDVADGGWLMLIRSPGPLATTTQPIHAWYRVVQSERDPTLISNYNDPVGSTGSHPVVWRRSVTLEGPDWNFATPTVAVLVDGVVSVVEFPVRLR